MESKAQSDFLKPKWGLLDGISLLLISLIFPTLVYLGLELFISLGLLPDSFNNFLSSTTPLSQAFVFFVSLIGEILLLSWIVHKYKLSWRVFGIKSFPIWRSIRYIISFYIVFAFVIAVIFTLLTQLFPSVDFDSVQQTGFENTTVWWQFLLGFVIIVILAPIFEELFFRGFLWPALSKRLGLIFGAIVSSTIFGALHFQTNVTIYTAILGLFLCFMYYRLKSTIPGIFLHMLNNLVAFLVLFKVI